MKLFETGGPPAPRPTPDDRRAESMSGVWGTAGRVDLRADQRGRRRLRDRLAAAFESEPIEDGMDHPAEHVIAAALDSEDPDVVLRWIRSICLDTTRPAFAAGVLLCVARQPRVGTAGWREELVRGGLAVDDVEVRDAAMQAAEYWGHSGLRPVLAAHTEPVAWLDEYRHGVVEDLGGERSADASGERVEKALMFR